MKKIIAIVIGICLMLAVSSKAAELYSVQLTTYSVTGSTINFALGGYPNIADTIDLSNLLLSTDGSAAIDVYFYKSATSTSAATSFFQVTLPATAGYYRPLGDFGTSSNERVRITDFAVYGSTHVWMTVLYH